MFAAGLKTGEENLTGGSAAVIFGDAFLACTGTRTVRGQCFFLFVLLPPLLLVVRVLEPLHI